MAIKTNISWFTPQAMDATGSSWRTAGYTEVSLRLFESLSERDQRVLWNASGTKCHVNYCLPYYYQFPANSNVGYTPWEFSAIPPTWLDMMRQCDQIWTTSSWCKEVYEQHELPVPVVSVPHGISKEWSVEERELRDKFYFLHVGGELPRKNVQAVISAFLDLYEGDEYFHLILKTDEKIRHIDLTPSFEEIKHHPQITIIYMHIPLESLIAIHHQSHCLVYPTLGEGFGLIPFQAIATGMPTICTNLTGCTEYAEMSMPLEADWADPSEEDLANFNLMEADAPKSAAPSDEHLRHLMKEVVEDYSRVKSKTMRSARILHEYHSWDAVADQILTLLKL